MKEITKYKIIGLSICAIILYLLFNELEVEGVRKVSQKKQESDAKPCTCNKMLLLDQQGNEIPCKC